MCGMEAIWKISIPIFHEPKTALKNGQLKKKLKPSLKQFIYNNRKNENSEHFPGHLRTSKNL